MLSVDECVGMVTSKVLGPLETQTVQLNAALGRILAKDAVAVEAIPAFPASIMDGFAMRSKDAPGKYPVDELAGTTAGADSRGPLREDHIRYITTGAPVPAGADTVVKVEDTHQLLNCIVSECIITRLRKTTCIASRVLSRSPAPEEIEGWWMRTGSWRLRCCVPANLAQTSEL